LLLFKSGIYRGSRFLFVLFVFLCGKEIPVFSVCLAVLKSRLLGVSAPLRLCVKIAGPFSRIQRISRLKSPVLSGGCGLPRCALALLR
jgi:hypothetical protein